MEAAGSAKIRILEARYYLIALNGKYVDQSHIFLYEEIGTDRMDIKIGIGYIEKLKNRQATYKIILQRALMKRKSSIRQV